LVPAFSGNSGERQTALLYNKSARFTTRWTDLKVVSDSPWLTGIDTISLPIAHGEGNFYTNTNNIRRLQNSKQIALKYTKGEMCDYLDYPPNPNGSIEDIAGITDDTGKILGLMPHPERGMFFNQLPNWQLTKELYNRENKNLPNEGPGLQIFKNAVKYFK
jgi:phosphoribosylformylglycinamidine synthase subunit PurQ / glutaminase